MAYDNIGVYDEALKNYNLALEINLRTIG